MYSQLVYELAVERAKPLIESGRFIGEVDHPFRGSLAGAAFRISKLWMDGDLMKAEAIILDTAGGRHLKALLEGGVGVAISTRGYGSAKYEKMTVRGKEDVEVAVIQSDFHLEGIDAVLFPSNPSGAVTHHENDNSPTQENNMDLETLRQEHPELVTQIEEAAREGYVAETEVEAQVQAAQESDEVKNLRSLLSAVVEAITPFVPELQKEADEATKSEAEQALEGLTAQVAELTAKLEEADKARETAEAERAEAEAAAERSKVIDGLLEGFAHAELIRPELEALADEDAIRATFESRKSLIESLTARKSVTEANEGVEEGAGAGTADTEGDDDLDTTPEGVLETINVHKSYISDL